MVGYILTFYGGIYIYKFISFIQRMFPNLAGKITGMLLEIDNAELVHMLEDQNSLKGKVCTHTFFSIRFSEFLVLQFLINFVFLRLRSVLLCS